jgi:hypothetical protein
VDERTTSISRTVSDRSDPSITSDFSSGSLSDVLSELLSLVPRSQRRAIEDLAARFKSGVIRLHVTGQYKRGKSTLANALIGRDVLPSGVLPLTALPTTVRKGQRDRLIVEYLNGQTEHAPIDDLAKYVTEEENPTNYRGVAKLSVTLASWGLPPMLEIVDTPGVGSVYVHNSVAATESLRDCDLALLVVSPEPPIGAQELEFLRHVASSSVWLVVALNKVDNVSHVALNEIAEFTLSAIRRVVDRPVEVVQTSATTEADTGVVHLRHQIVQACGERGRVLLDASVARRARTAALGAAQLLRMEAAAAALPAQESRRRIHKLTEALDAIELRRRDLKAVIGACKQRVVAVLDEDIDRFRASATETLIAAAPEVAAQSQRLDLAEARLDGLMADVALSWRDSETQRLLDLLQRELENFGRAASLFEREARESAAALFRVELSSKATTAELPELPDFRLDFSEELLSLEIGYRSVISFLPGSWRSKAFQRVLRDRAVRKADRQAGRIRYDFLERISEFILAVHRVWDDRYADITTTLKEIAVRGKEASEHSAEAAAELSSVCRERADRLDSLSRFLEHY